VRGARSTLGQRSPHDADADGTKRGHQAFFGYKAHLAMDQGSELIRAAIMTSAKVGDSVIADRLIGGDERAVYADKGYENSARSARLAQLGITDGIMRKLIPHSRDPHPVLAARNRRLGRIRGAVERKFAVLKERYRCRRVRYRGLLKNQLHVADLLCDEPQARARAAGHRMSARPPQQCVCSSEIASTSVAAPPNRTLLTS
jgi:transposase, IS5 family